MLDTLDPDIKIEEKREGYIRYRHTDGRRWIVRGECDKRGWCLVGATLDGEYVATRARARELALAYEGPDVPVGPGFAGCCPLKVRSL